MKVEEIDDDSDTIVVEEDQNDSTFEAHQHHDNLSEYSFLHESHDTALISNSRREQQMESILGELLDVYVFEHGDIGYVTSVYTAVS